MKKGLLNVLCVFVLFSSFTSCSTSKSRYQKEYAKIWKEMIKSDAWKNALVTPNVIQNQEQNDYASIEDDVVLANETSSNVKLVSDFENKYSSLVSRAYFKIIAEAENADVRIKANMEYWNAKGNTENPDKTLKRNVFLAKQKYEAHSEMLKGLKSWNIFSEERTADLDAFKAENEVEIHGMYTKGDTDRAMINLLVYKLADLYH